MIERPRGVIERPRGVIERPRGVIERLAVRRAPRRAALAAIVRGGQ